MCTSVCLCCACALYVCLLCMCAWVCAVSAVCVLECVNSVCAQVCVCDVYVCMSVSMLCLCSVCACLCCVYALCVCMSVHLCCVCMCARVCVAVCAVCGHCHCIHMGVIPDRKCRCGLGVPTSAGWWDRGFQLNWAAGLCPTPLNMLKANGLARKRGSSVQARSVHAASAHPLYCSSPTVLALQGVLSLGRCWSPGESSEQELRAADPGLHLHTAITQHDSLPKALMGPRMDTPRLFHPQAKGSASW